MTTSENCGTHRVTFKNLTDSRTREPLQVEVPNSLIYEGALLYARFMGQQMGDDFRKLLSKKE